MPYFVQAAGGHWINLSLVVVLLQVKDTDGKLIAYTCRTADGTDLGMISPTTLVDAFGELNHGRSH